MLSVIKIDDSQTWDNIVTSFKNYDVFYLNKYVEAFQIHGDGTPYLIYYNDGNTRAINVVMIRDISCFDPFINRLPQNKLFDVSTPYGYGGFLVNGKASEDFEESYYKYCQDKGFVSEFVRFHLFSDYNKYFTGGISSQTLNVIRSLEMPIEGIIMDFEHKVRKNIKKANRAGLSILIDNSGKYLSEFIDIYYQTMDRNRANPYFSFSEEFFKKINELTGNYVYFHVIYDKRIISTELVLYGNDFCYSFLGGTAQDFFDLRPNDFLKFEIIKWAKNKKLKYFILGGGYGDNDGIFKYKKSFAPKGVVKFFIGKRIFDEEKYKYLLALREYYGGFDEETKFFPKYRG